MELINSDSNEVVETAPVVEQEPVITRPAAIRTLNEDEVVTHRVVPPFMRIIAWIVGIAILAFLIVIAARWIYHKSHHAVQTVPANTKKLPTQPSGFNTNGAVTTAPPSTSSSHTSGNSSSASNNSNLPNSGPGDTAAIFAGATLAAAGAHYLISDRRAGRQQL